MPPENFGLIDLLTQALNPDAVDAPLVGGGVLPISASNATAQLGKPAVLPDVVQPERLGIVPLLMQGLADAINAKAAALNPNVRPQNFVEASMERLQRAADVANQRNVQEALLSDRARREGLRLGIAGQHRAEDRQNRLADAARAEALAAKRVDDLRAQSQSDHIARRAEEITDSNVRAFRASLTLAANKGVAVPPGMKNSEEVLRLVGAELESRAEGQTTVEENRALSTAIGEITGTLGLPSQMLDRLREGAYTVDDARDAFHDQLEFGPVSELPPQAQARYMKFWRERIEPVLRQFELESRPPVKLGDIIPGLGDELNFSSDRRTPGPLAAERIFDLNELVRAAEAAKSGP